MFIQPDWFEVTEAGVGTNRYAYSFNDPVNLSDPGGNAFYNDLGDFFSLALDFTPVVGDVKGFVEAETGWDYAFAVVGVFPLIGDAIQKGRKLGRGLLKNGSKSRINPCNSFHAETPVLTPDGLVWISNISIGDLVWSRDEETGRIAAKAVLKVFRQIHENSFKLTIMGGNGQVENVIASGNHPVFVEGKGWIAVSAIQVGDHISGKEAGSVVVELLSQDEPLDAFNLDVTDYDTFFVGRNGIWVHNEDVNNREDAYNQARRDAGITKRDRLTDQYTVGDDPTRRGQPGYVYNENKTTHGRYEIYETQQGKQRGVVMQTSSLSVDGKIVSDVHYHAIEPIDGQKSFRGRPSDIVDGSRVDYANAGAGHYRTGPNPCR